MFKIQKSIAGVNLWHLTFNDQPIGTYSTRWEAKAQMDSLARTYRLAPLYA